MEAVLKSVTSQNIWRLCSSITTGIFLLFGIFLFLLAGYFLWQGNEELLVKINDLGLKKWLFMLAINRWQTLWWFLGFLLFLFLLVINTVLCTGHRLFRLIRLIHSLPGFYNAPYLRLCIHGMHLGFIVVLAGYTASYTLSQGTAGVVLVPGKDIPIREQGLSIKLLRVRNILYQGRIKPFRGNIIDVKALLAVKDQTGRAIRSCSFNHALLFNGFIITIKNFSKITGRPWIMVDIRRDPGLYIYIPGILLLAFSGILFLIFKVSSCREAAFL